MGVNQSRRHDHRTVTAEANSFRALKIYAQGTRDYQSIVWKPGRRNMEQASDRDICLRGAVKERHPFSLKVSLQWQDTLNLAVGQGATNICELFSLLFLLEAKSRGIWVDFEKVLEWQLGASTTAVIKSSSVLWGVAQVSFTTFPLYFHGAPVTGNGFAENKSGVVFSQMDGPLLSGLKFQTVLTIQHGSQQPIFVTERSCSLINTE